MPDTSTLDAEFQRIIFAVHLESDDAATRAAIEYASDEIKVAMSRAHSLGASTRAAF